MTGCQILRFEQVYGLVSNDTYSDVFTHTTMLASRSLCTPHTSLSFLSDLICPRT